MDKEKTKNSVQLLKEAKRAVWLNRWLWIPINKKHQPFIVTCEACSEKFLKWYLTTDNLTEEAQNIFIDKYIQSNTDLVKVFIDYAYTIRQYAQEQIFKSKNIDLVFALINREKCFLSAVTIHSAAKTALVKLNDVDFLSKILMHGIDLSSAVSEVVKLNNPRMLSLILERPKYELYDMDQDYIIKSGNKEMIDVLIKYRTLRDSIIRDSLATDNEYVLRKYFDTHSISADLQVFMVDKGYKKYLALYLKKHSLSYEALVAIIKRDWKDILKLQYKLYGMPENALAYYSNFHHFKQDINI